MVMIKKLCVDEFVCVLMRVSVHYIHNVKIL